MGGRYDDRVRDLLVDAEAAAEAGDWDSVRDLAGAALALRPGDESAQDLLERASAGSTSGERRQLTVMFCDVVGSTALSQDHDPELVSEVLRSYQVTCDRVVRRYEGRIARFIGDGVLAYFGHPIAHEDDARRGVQAGFELLDALRPVVEEVRGRYDIDLRIRVAVHTGLVVRADMGSAATPDRDAIVGETPNIAARLQDHATPGTLLISHDTYELVRPWFLVAPRGALELKGIARPMRAYEVVQEAGDDDRVRAQADLTPFVGRSDELASLLDAWAEVQAGGSRAVGISGQPGVGKSRLADVLRRRVEADDGGARHLQCSSFHHAIALHPVRRLLERVAGIEPNQSPDVALPKLWGAMDAVGQADKLPLVASLLELPPTDWCPAPELDGPKLREALLSSLVDWLAAAAGRGPLLLVVEDLQWADPTTHELLARVLGLSVPGLLVVATVREDSKVPWPSAEVISLDRLSSDDLAELARRSPEGRHLEPEHIEQLIQRSDGIPLYLEELLRNADLSHAGLRPDSTIPAALRDLLLARFAAPGVDLRLAQVLATIGYEAPLPLVAAASAIEPELLGRQLAALVDASIVTVLPGEPVAYRFRHHLLAELAYDTQLQAARREAHGAVADAIEAGRAGTAVVAPAVRAHHLEQAGRLGEAIWALSAAAEDAHQLGANAEVAELLARAFELLDALPEAERPMHEFEVRLVRGMNTASILGFAAPSAAEDFTACRDLVADRVRPGSYLDDLEHGQQALWASAALWANFLLQGRIDDAHTVNRNTVAALRPDGPLWAYYDAGLCYVQFFQGDYAAALPGFEFSCTQADDGLINRLTVPSHPKATAWAHRAFTLAIGCRSGEARAASDAGLAFSRALPFPIGPFSVCYGLSIRSSIEILLGDLAAARASVTELLELSERHGFTFWSIIGGYYDAHLDLCSGVPGALERCQMSLMMMQAIGVMVWAPYFEGSVGQLLFAGGQADEARVRVDAAAAVAESSGAHYWSADLARLDGELRLAAGDPSGLDRLRDAVALATQQGATLHELAARTALVAATGDDDERSALSALLERVAEGAPPEAVATARALLVT